MITRSLIVGAALAAILTATQIHADTSAAQPAGRWRQATLDEYRTHLQALTGVVEACARARDMKTCDPALIGPDDRVPLSQAANAERRLVRYGWLRVLLSNAQDKDAQIKDVQSKDAQDKDATKMDAQSKEKDQAENKSIPVANGAPRERAARPPAPTTSQLLQDAETRLAHDLTQANAAAAGGPMYSQERDAMSKVLAGRDFRDLEEPSARDSLLEKFGNWLNRLFEGARQFGARSAWIARLLVWGFILAVCVGLVWGLLQLERRWRIRLVPEDTGGAAGAASARDWQLWLEDARKAAAGGLWREAIHFVYWAAISRLESRRLWPADRARTPREYLALVAPEDPRKPGLATLTGSFERTWYGGRAASEGEYRQAEQLATDLIAGNAAYGSGAG